MEPFPIPSDRQLLQTIIEPLLEDFIYWFNKSETMLTSQRINFLAKEEQSAMISKIQKHKQEISAAQSLFRAMNSAVIIEPSQVQKWHAAVKEYWSIAVKLRNQRTADS
jgi:hypothetical protein